MTKSGPLLAGVCACALTACGGAVSNLPPEAGYGPNPTLPEPKPEKPLPSIKIADAVGWSGGEAPTAPAGFAVTAIARDLKHPRWLHVLPNGDILVAETNRPANTGKKGIRAWFQKKIMAKAGAGPESANQITLLRDADGDGRFETRTIFLEGLNSPFGMAHIGGSFYVANTDAVVRFPYQEGQTQITAPGVKLADLPAGSLNHHWTKSLIASRDGTKLYATVGSNSNVGEEGMENEVNRAAILEIDAASGATRLFASGLRNPNGMGWEPVTGALWTSVNERDEIGPDLVPDYMTSVRDGGFYGWPYSYWGQNVDVRIKPARPDLVAKAIRPDYGLGAHTASLGFTFYEGASYPARYQGGAFVGQHGSWNRKPRIGYKVVFVPFQGGKPAGMAEDFLTGFLNADGEARGRPVGVAVDRTGALLVADDVGDVIWRVTAAAAPPSALPPPAR